MTWTVWSEVVRARVGTQTWGVQLEGLEGRERRFSNSDTNT